MKRILALFIIMTVALGLFGCNTAATTNHSDEITTVAAEPSTTAPTEAPEEIHWTKEYYVDDFGDPTRESYIRGIFYGSFSNSATAASDLEAILALDKKMNSSSNDMFSIRLLEYGDTYADLTGYNEYVITIKVKIDGVVTEDQPDYIVHNQGLLVIMRGNKIFSAVLNALDADREISFVITVGINSSSTYRFTVDANGLEDIPHAWAGKI